MNLYLSAICAFFATIFAHLLWDLTVGKRKDDKERLRLARRMFHLGKVEGSNQIHACQNPELGIKEKSFDEYLSEENEKSISNNN